MSDSLSLIATTIIPSFRFIVSSKEDGNKPTGGSPQQERDTVLLL
jgi:hypothetical protein